MKLLRFILESMLYPAEGGEYNEIEGKMCIRVSLAELLTSL